jgi:hypothetical protein
MELYKPNHLLQIRVPLMLRTIMAFSLRKVMELHKINHLLLTITNSLPITATLLLRTILAKKKATRTEIENGGEVSAGKTSTTIWTRPTARPCPPPREGPLQPRIAH